MAIMKMPAVGVEGGVKETVLWTNPSPSADFSFQNVTLSQGISNFDALGFVYKKTKSDSTATLKNTYESLDAFIADNSARPVLAYQPYYRPVSYVSDTSISIGHAYRVADSGTDNSYATPYQVLGIKY